MKAYSTLKRLVGKYEGIGISTACSECHAVSGEYGAANCKAECKSGTIGLLEVAESDFSEGLTGKNAAEKRRVVVEANEGR